MIRWYLYLFTFVVCWPALAEGQIILSQNFDSGSLDVAASTVNGNSIDLVARHTWSGINGYRWVYFSADNVMNVTPQFTISENDFLGSYTNHRYVFSYDQQNWEFFDNASINGGDYEFSNNTPFSQNMVYIAYGLPYPVARVETFVQNLQSNSFITATASGDSNFVVGQSAAGIDDVGRNVPAQNIYGFKLTAQQVTGSKRRVLLAGGSHSCENAGNYVLEGMLDFLLSTDSRAQYLRETSEFFVYPLTNPSGRFGGYYRSTPENPDKDYNRFYDDPIGFTDLSALTAAMQSDTDSDVDILVDFHSWFGSWTSENFIYTVGDNVDDPFFMYLDALEPGLLPTASSGVPGMLRIWGSSLDGLNADFALTPEIGFHPFRYENDLKAIGSSFGIALYERSVPEIAAAELFAITRGNLSGGGIPELAQSDNNDVMAIRANGDVESRVFFTFGSISPVDAPSSFEFSIESSVFARSQVDQSIDLFNFDTDSWEEVYTALASRFTDTTVVLDPSGELSRFVQPGTGMIESRCRYESINPRQQFSANVDHVFWEIGR